MIWDFLYHELTNIIRQVADTRINEEQGEVNVGCFKIYELEHMHTVNKINRQHILSYLKPHPHTSYPSAPRKLFQFPRQTMTDPLHIFGKQYYVCCLECPIQPELSSSQLNIQYRLIWADFLPLSLIPSPILDRIVSYLPLILRVA